MTVTVIAMVTVAEDAPHALARYLDATAPLLASVQAKVARRFNTTELLHPDRPGMTVIITEYPDREAVYEMFESELYQALIPLRDQAFTSYQINIADRPWK